MACPFKVSHGASCHYLASAACRLVTFDCSAILHDWIFEGWDWPLVFRADMSGSSISNETYCVWRFLCSFRGYGPLKIVCHHVPVFSAHRRYLWVDMYQLKLPVRAQDSLSWPHNFQNKWSNKPLSEQWAGLKFNPIQRLNVSKVMLQ